MPKKAKKKKTKKINKIKKIVPVGPPKKKSVVLCKIEKYPLNIPQLLFHIAHHFYFILYYAYGELPAGLPIWLPFPQFNII